MKNAKKIKKLKGVKLWFDDDEYCFIPVEHIENLNAEFSKYLSYDKEGDSSEYTMCKLHLLEVSNTFLINTYPRINEKCINEKIKLYDKLKDQDVLQISFIYLNNKSKECILPWLSYRDGANGCQAFSCTDRNTSILSIREHPFICE